MTGFIYFLFFCSGVSGLIYQIVWIRMFGNVFGNTIYSAAVVVGVFMLGLGIGSYVVGAWADRRYAESLQANRVRDPSLRAYGYFELLIGLLGTAIAALWPHLGQLSARMSSYSRDGGNWYVLSTASHVAYGLIALVMLAPVTFLMGGTLTLLIRHRVRGDLEAGAHRIAMLYAVNTAGAAVGCFLTDFALVPIYGLASAQIVAAALNIAAGTGALWLALRLASGYQSTTATLQTELARVGVRRGRPLGPPDIGRPEGRPLRPLETTDHSLLGWTSVALGMSGFAAMGMEILWFRHFVILLGEFRAVLSLLLTVILVGIGVGSFAGSALLHRSPNLSAAAPARWLIVVQCLFVAASLSGLAAADAETIKQTAMVPPGYQRALQELWFNARPILAEVAVPALLMGFAFPLGNAVVQRVERSVGRRAGLLYLANTAGAVAGSLTTGFVLLPMLGVQLSATMLMLAAGAAAAPLSMASRTLAPGERSTSHASRSQRGRAPVLTTAGSIVVAAVTFVLWLLLPSQYVITHAQVVTAGNGRLLTVSEGITEVVAVADIPGRGRLLLTNGHPMSSTDLLSQRYMRALAHIPLLSIDNPQNVLVMCFGVGNTAHAATLHPSVRRVEVVDLSRHVLDHAEYFRDANRDVLKDRRVAVFVNDGRHHLQMQREVSYDVITLEPPPITQAGTGALYSREFYARARMRLKPGGYMSQWLPVAGVPAATTLAMIRAFIDVFPQSVLLSGAHTNLLLIGVNDSRIEIDPDRMAAALSRAPAVQADLERLDLGSVREIVGTFVASAQTLSRATHDALPSTDDRPVQEYGVRSLLKSEEAPPPSIVDLSGVAAWCPTCFANGKPAPLVDGLDTYLELLALVYRAGPGDVQPALRPSDSRPRTIAGSAYLGAVVPESANLHNVLGAALAAKGNVEDAIAEFREALRLDPASATAHWNLGRTLAAPEEALPHLKRAVELDPRNGQARYHLATAFLESRRYDDALREFREALELMPESFEVHNNLGVTLASQGKLDEAITQFRTALTLKPEFADAQRNLRFALQEQRRRGK